MSNVGASGSLELLSQTSGQTIFGSGRPRIRAAGTGSEVVGQLRMATARVFDAASPQIRLSHVNDDYEEPPWAIHGLHMV
jgi:hypothetical protein